MKNLFMAGMSRTLETWNLPRPGYLFSKIILENLENLEYLGK